MLCNTPYNTQEPVPYTCVFLTTVLSDGTTGVVTVNTGFITMTTGVVTGTTVVFFGDVVDVVFTGGTVFVVVFEGTVVVYGTTGVEGTPTFDVKH